MRVVVMVRAFVVRPNYFITTLKLCGSLRAEQSKQHGSQRSNTAAVPRAGYDGRAHGESCASVSILTSAQAQAHRLRRLHPSC